MLPDRVVEKFNNGVVRGEGTSCWPFLGGSYNKRGWHRTISYNGPPKRNFLAHRVAYELAYGEIPDSLCVLHKCDNPECCNPSHLFLGTRADNARDMWGKDRGRGGGKVGNKTGPSPLRTLTRDSLAWAVAQYLNGRTQKEIAAELGVTDVALGYAFRGKTYEDLADVVAPIAHLLGRSTKTRGAALVRKNQAIALRDTGMKQHDIAAALGICQAAVSNYLRNRDA